MAQHNFITRILLILDLYALLVLMLTNAAHARIGYFWHITDLHLDTIYSTQGDVLRSCWRLERQQPNAAPRSPGRFGDYLCDSPWSLIESAAKAMKSRQGDNVEFVLWTGDGLSHSAHHMNEAKKFEILRNITDLLGRTFSSQFVFPVLGHEDGTTTKFSRMGELWRHWLPSEALHTFERGGYYSIEQTKSRLRIIVLNTNFMRHDPKSAQSHLQAVRQRTPNSPDAPEYKNYYYQYGNVHQHHGHMSDWSGHGYSYNGHHRGYSAIPPDAAGAGVGAGGSVNGAAGIGGARVSALSEYENQETEKQWLWLEDVLSKSRNNKETVYIVGHMPPGSDERHIGLQQNGLTTFTEGTNKRYLDLVREYSSIIQGQFFGHLHSDSFRIIYDDKGTPVSWIMISPSVTPRKINGGSNNPAMRLYKFDTDSGQVLDYTQYYMDLQSANNLGEPNWVPEYNLTHYYALTDISAISLHNFVDRFTSSDGTWFAKYYRANSVRYQLDQCEGVCMLNHYCAITRVDYTEFRQCLEKEQSALRSHATATIGQRATAASTCLWMLVLVCVACCRDIALLLLNILAFVQQLDGHIAELLLRGKRQFQIVAIKRYLSAAGRALIMMRPLPRNATGFCYAAMRAIGYLLQQQQEEQEQQHEQQAHHALTVARQTRNADICNKRALAAVSTRTMTMMSTKQWHVYCGQPRSALMMCSNKQRMQMDIDMTLGMGTGMGTGMGMKNALSSMATKMRPSKSETMATTDTSEIVHATMLRPKTDFTFAVCRLAGNVDNGISAAATGMMRLQHECRGNNKNNHNKNMKTIENGNGDGEIMLDSQNNSNSSSNNNDGAVPIIMPVIAATKMKLAIASNNMQYTTINKTTTTTTNNNNKNTIMYTINSNNTTNNSNNPNTKTIHTKAATTNAISSIKTTTANANSNATLAVATPTTTTTTARSYWHLITIAKCCWHSANAARKHSIQTTTTIHQIASVILLYLPYCCNVAIMLHKARPHPYTGKNAYRPYNNCVARAGRLN